MSEQEAERLLKIIRQFSTDLAERIETQISRLDRGVQGLQRELLTRLLSDYNANLQTLNGVLLFNDANLLSLATLDRLVDDFSRNLVSGEMSQFGRNLLTVAESVTQYYAATGFAEGQLRQIAEALNVISAYVGIRADGSLVAGGYLDRLAKLDAVKIELSNYVRTSLAAGTPLRQYTSGLENLLKGTRSVDGVLQRYYRQYAYDSFNQVSEAANELVAQQLDLQYFIYEGTVIDTTRAFCKKRAGKVYSVAETTDWKNDHDLIDKATKAQYRPLIERGRYNCRHQIRYISEALALKLRPDLK